MKQCNLKIAEYNISKYAKCPLFQISILETIIFPELTILLNFPFYRIH